MDATKTTKAIKRKCGEWNARFMSLDMGVENLAVCIADVCVHGTIKRKKFNSYHLPMKTDIVSHFPGAVVGVTVLEWKVIRVTEETSDMQRTKREQTNEIVNKESRIMDVMIQFVTTGNLEKIISLSKEYDIDVFLMEQQIGPIKRPGFFSEGNPTMLSFMNALAMVMTASSKKMRARPPVIIGPNASIKTCDEMQQDNSLWKNENRMLSKTEKPKQKAKWKKRQVVFVVDELMNQSPKEYATNYWAAGDKRDDLADSLIQIFSYCKLRIAPLLRKEMTKRVLQTTLEPEMTKASFLHDVVWERKREEKETATDETSRKETFTLDVEATFDADTKKPQPLRFTISPNTASRKTDHYEVLDKYGLRTTIVPFFCVTGLKSRLQAQAVLHRLKFYLSPGKCSIAHKSIKYSGKHALLRRHSKRHALCRAVCMLREDPYFRHFSRRDDWSMHWNES